VVSEDQSQQIQQAFAQSEEDQPQSQPTETVTIGVEDPTIPPQIATAVAGFPLVSVTATPDGATTTTQSQIAKVGDIVHITYSSSDGIVNGHFCKVTQDGRLWIDDWKSTFNLKDASQGVQVLGVFRLPQDYKVDLADIHPNSPIKIQHWGTGSGKGYLYTFASSDPSIFGCVRANLTDHGDQ